MESCEPVDQLLLQVQRTLDLSPGVITPTGSQRYGHPISYLQEGRCRLEKVKTLYATQTELEHQQQLTTRALETAWEEAEACYLVHRQLARQAFTRDFPRQRTLGLDRLPQQNLAGWLEQATLFYARLREDAEGQLALARLNLSLFHLEEGEALVQRAAELYKAQKREEQKARQIAHELETELNALSSWLGERQRATYAELSRAPVKAEPAMAGPLT